ncbi:MAG: ankyrin repeat domain-containing protein [Raineya sp.]|nr:ankyrin repeat domain-containing protein [Raineya sp.]MDW8295996.1 ankyrin repeat domain-containing protein [Raineya sp.]
MKKQSLIFVFFIFCTVLYAQTEIFEAIRDDNRERFMQLVQDAKNINLSIRWQEKTWVYENFTPLMQAVSYQREEMVLELLKRKAKVNAKCKVVEGYEIDKCDAKVTGLTALHMAAAKGNENIVKLLLRAKADTQEKVKIKFRHQECYKTKDGWFVEEFALGPQGYAETFGNHDIARIIRTAKGSKWIKEPIK